MARPRSVAFPRGHLGFKRNWLVVAERVRELLCPRLLGGSPQRAPEGRGEAGGLGGACGASGRRELLRRETVLEL